MKIKLLISFIALLDVLAFAVSEPPDTVPNYFIATNGTMEATGRRSDPLSIGVLFEDSTFTGKTNGAVFWVRGGTYGYGDIYDYLTATGIVVRAYPFERPIINKNIRFDGNNSSNTWRNLFVISTNVNRTWLTTNDEDAYCGFQIETAPGTQVIGNCVMGWPSGGMEDFDNAPGLVAYGNCFVANGYETDSVTKKNFGHSIYSHNIYPSKIIRLNHLWFSVSSSFDIRSTNSKVDNYVIQSNFCANGEIIGTLAGTYGYEFSLITGATNYGVSNIVVSGNIIFRDTPSALTGNIQLGNNEIVNNGPGTYTNWNVQIENNIFAAGYIELGEFGPPFSFKSNIVYSDSGNFVLRHAIRGESPWFTAGDFDYNQWYGNGNDGRQFQVYTNQVPLDIYNPDVWRGMVLGDSNSTVSVDAPTNVIVRVWPNAFRDDYDDWWGDIAVWNPNRRSNNITAQLTGMPAGTGFDIRFTGNLLGPSVANGIYNGTSVTVPLTNLPSYVILDQDWPAIPQPTNGASFRVYISQNSPRVMQTKTMQVKTLRL